MKHSGALLSIIGVGVAVGSTHGALISFTLLDHPDGGADPPPYGLRFDDAFVGLGGASGGTTSFSFDAAFNDAGRTDVTLTVDTVNGTIVIDGEVFGGEDTGVTYGFGAGWYDVHFEYTANVMASGGGWIVDPGSHLNNTGFFRSQGNPDIAAGTTFNFSDINMPLAFEFLPDGHRLAGDDSTWVGRGWVTSDPDGNDESPTRDWLFQAIPAPGTLGLCGLGMIGMGMRRRR